MSDCFITVNVRVIRDSDNNYGTPPSLRVEDDGDGEVKLTLSDPDRDITVDRAALMRALKAVGDED